MKKHIIFTIATSCFASFATNAMTYNEGIENVRKIESSYNKCLIAENSTHDIDHAECADTSQKQYDKLIVSIRKQYPKAVDPKVWQSINLGHIERTKACRNDYNYLMTRVYYVKPNILCEQQAYKSLALSAIKLHLK
jgi:hypothetical protein